MLDDTHLRYLRSHGWSFGQIVATFPALRRSLGGLLLRRVYCLFRRHAVSQMDTGRFCDRCQTFLDWTPPARTPLGPDHLAVLQAQGWTAAQIRRVFPTLAPWLVLALLVAGCSSSPTAPTPVPTPVSVVTPTPPSSNPPVVAPPVATNPLLSDPRFSLSFYRMFALGEQPDGSFTTLRRQTQAPRIYLRTIDDAGKAIDAYTLNETAAALINTAGKLTGVFGLAGLEQGAETREGQPGWITVRWSDRASQYCGYASEIGGSLITLYPKTSGCRCSGGPQVRPYTVKHELGHVLGFSHTGDITDLMSGVRVEACDKDPSPREVFHAQVAYSQPQGSLNPR